MSRTMTTTLRAGLMAAMLALPSAAWAQQTGATPAPTDANAPAYSQAATSAIAGRAGSDNKVKTTASARDAWSA